MLANGRQDPDDDDDDAKLGRMRVSFDWRARVFSKNVEWQGDELEAREFFSEKIISKRW